MLRRISSDRGENRDPGTVAEVSKRLLTRETRLENGPLGARSSLGEILMFDAIAVMCPAYLRGI